MYSQMLGSVMVVSSNTRTPIEKGMQYEYVYLSQTKSHVQISNDKDHNNRTEQKPKQKGQKNKCRYHVMHAIGYAENNSRKKQSRNKTERNH